MHMWRMRGRWIRWRRQRKVGNPATDESMQSRVNCTIEEVVNLIVALLSVESVSAWGHQRAQEVGFCPRGVYLQESQSPVTRTSSFNPCPTCTSIIRKLKSVGHPGLDTHPPSSLVVLLEGTRAMDSLSIICRPVPQSVGCALSNATPCRANTLLMARIDSSLELHCPNLSFEGTRTMNLGEKHHLRPYRKNA